MIFFEKLLLVQLSILVPLMSPQLWDTNISQQCFLFFGDVPIQSGVTRTSKFKTCKYAHLRCGNQKQVAFVVCGDREEEIGHRWSQLSGEFLVLTCLVRVHWSKAVTWRCQLTIRVITKYRFQYGFLCSESGVINWRKYWHFLSKLRTKMPTPSARTTRFSTRLRRRGSSAKQSPERRPNSSKKLSLLCKKNQHNVLECMHIIIPIFYVFLCYVSLISQVIKYLKIYSYYVFVLFLRNETEKNFSVHFVLCSDQYTSISQYTFRCTYPISTFIFNHTTSTTVKLEI